MRDSAAIEQKIEDAIDDGDGPVLSVFCQQVDQRGVAAAVERACREGAIRNGKIQVARVSTLLDVGAVLVHTAGQGEPECHYHVNFEKMTSDTRATMFLGCFAEPEPNPWEGRR